MKTWMACIPLLVFPFAYVGGAAEPTNDSLTQVKRNVAEGKAVLVDVREKAEWNKGCIEGAVCLPLSELQRGVDAARLQKQLPAGTIIYTHCVVGKRAVTAANILEKYGYEVRPLKPGYKDLLQAGFPNAKN